MSTTSRSPMILYSHLKDVMKKYVDTTLDFKKTGEDDYHISVYIHGVVVGYIAYEEKELKHAISHFKNDRKSILNYVSRQIRAYPYEISKI